MRKALQLSWLYLSFSSLHAQINTKNDRSFQLSLTPGLTTSGLQAGANSNYFSLNLTSGYSNANYVFEAGVISNLNVQTTRGFQIAGIANLTGANAYAGLSKRDAELKVKSGFEANLTGIQVSGITNIVINNVFGSQITGGFNEARGALLGFQLAGISNTVRQYTFGLQLAGVSNTSRQSMDGVQLSALANYTEGELLGAQIGSINKAGIIAGKNSVDNPNPTGFQIGLFNMADKMNGFQIGLINFGKRMQGTQIGLINIYRSGKTPMTRDGTSVGLINVGDFGHISYSVNELFYNNIEASMGNAKNSRMQGQTKTIFVENALIYCSSASWQSGSETEKTNRWALGYGLRKYYINRSLTPGESGKWFFGYGIDGLHINTEAGKITKQLSLLLRPGISAGFSLRLHPNLRGIYIYGTLSGNFYFSPQGEPIMASLSSTSTLSDGRQVEMWPGFSAGIMVHQ